MKQKFVVIGIVIGVLISALLFVATGKDANTQGIENEQADAAPVEIALSDKLDGVTNNYCFDIAGGNKDIDVSKGLQAHTCYSYRGSLGADQIFDASEFINNKLYMPEFDVCASLDGLEAGSKVGLSACDDSDLQALTFGEDGRISPVAASDMCLTAAKDTRFGRSKQHQIKALTLEACSEELSSFQTWRARIEQD